MIRAGSAGRVLHVIPFLWSGAGDVVSRLAVSQSAYRPVGIVTSGRSRGQSDWFRYCERLHAAGVEHFRIDTFDRASDVFWESVEKFGRLVEQWKPDVVHCHAGVPAAVASVIRDRGAEFRLIGQLHSWGPDRPAWMDRMDLWAFGKCDTVITNSRDYGRILARSGMGEDRIVSVPWGLDFDAIDALRHSRGRNSARAPRIGFVGRVERRKRQADLVRAVGELRSAGIDAHLDLVGPVADEEYAREVRLVVNELGLEDRVTLHGFVENVYEIVRTWNLFVSMSSDEGQGMAVLEAMALGVPVITSDAPGVRDFIAEWNNAMLVRFASPARVAAAMKWLLENPHVAARMAGNARRAVKREYDWGATVAGMERIYQQMAHAT